MAADFEKWVIRKGGADSRTFQFVNGDGTDRDVSALSCSFVVFSDLGATTLLTKSGVTGSTSALKVVTISASDTASLSGQYLANLTLSDGTKKQGTLQISGY